VAYEAKQDGAPTHSPVTESSEEPVTSQPITSKQNYFKQH